jgi:hypothetical protein
MLTFSIIKQINKSYLSLSYKNFNIILKSYAIENIIPADFFLRSYFIKGEHII